MNIEFHRLPGGYCSQAVRDDGVTVHVPGFDRKHTVPHDLAHFAAEHGCGVARGFWGSVAAGAMFGGMKVLAGRRPPHAAERSRRVIRANAAEIGVAEALAESVFQAYDNGLSAEQAAGTLARHWASIRTDPCPYGPEALSAACALLTGLAERWHATPPGTGMTLDWTLPVERVELPPPARRAARIRR